MWEAREEKAVMQPATPTHRRYPGHVSITLRARMYLRTPRGPHRRIGRGRQKRTSITTEISRGEAS